MNYESEIGLSQTTFAISAIMRMRAERQTVNFYIKCVIMDD